MIIPIRQIDEDNIIFDDYNKVNFAKNIKVQNCISKIDSLFEELFDFTLYRFNKKKLTLFTKDGSRFRFDFDENNNPLFIG